MWSRIFARRLPGSMGSLSKQKIEGLIPDYLKLVIIFLLFWSNACGIFYTFVTLDDAISNKSPCKSAYKNK